MSSCEKCGDFCSHRGGDPSLLQTISLTAISNKPSGISLNSCDLGGPNGDHICSTPDISESECTLPDKTEQ